MPRSQTRKLLIQHGEVGRRGWTRTSDHLLRRQVLYPPELRARVSSFLILKYFVLVALFILAAYISQTCIKTPPKFIGRENERARITPRRSTRGEEPAG